MAATVPIIEPSSFTAGDSVEFTVSPGDYPPSEGWVASYTLILATTRKPFTVTDDGVSTYTVTLAADVVADITTQIEARLVGTVVGAGEFAGQRHVIYSRPITILANPLASTLTSMRSTAQVELDALNVAILGLTEGKIASYSIGGRAVSYNDLPSLRSRAAVLEGRVRAESGRGFRRRLVAFV